MLDAYSTGRGKVIVRARAKIEDRIAELLEKDPSSPRARVMQAGLMMGDGDIAGAKQKLAEVLGDKSINGFIFDLTPFVRDEDSANKWAISIEGIIDSVINIDNVYLIVDKRYTYNILDLLFYKIEDTRSFESLLEM